MTAARERRRPVHASTVIDFPGESESLKIAIDRHREALEETNKCLSVIANCADETLRFFKKIIPWSVLAIGIAYPSIGKIISMVHLPS